MASKDIGMNFSARLTKVPSELPAKKVELYEEAEAEARKWNVRCLKEGVAVTSGENFVGTRISGREVIRNVRQSNDGTEAYGYYDLRGVAGMLLETKKRPRELALRSEAEDHIFRTIKRTMKIPPATYPGEGISLEFTKLPSGRKLWYGHMSRDLLLDGNLVLSRLSWWTSFLVWSDGKQTYWQWPLEDPADGPEQITIYPHPGDGGPSVPRFKP
ncbi:hypothetical protein EON81_13025 [bacterium]|nr:MAG: hypothetical protein EON81_13025 [bacterium]